jgi:adenosylcobinamide kinase/adenosylcobinamide-phosphate guanylyltransferase
VKTLVLGGVRSGKSRHAEALAQSAGGPITVIVTGTAGDEEMAARIAAHRAKRPAHWSVVEEPLRLASALSRAATGQSVIIVDCLTLWLSNLLCHSDPRMYDAEVEALLAVLRGLPGTQLLVGNEVGSGIMPINDLARRFGDASGSLYQRLAAICDGVVLMVAGLPLVLKGGDDSQQVDARNAR